MLQEAIGYPKRGDWVSRILIGGLLSILSFLIIPSFIVLGYLLRVLGDSYDGIEDPPEWGEWMSLLIKGLVGWLIGLVYSIPLILFSVVMIPILGVSGLDDGALTLGAGLIWFLGTVILGILIGYLLPAGLTAYARTDQAGAAFKFKEVTSIAFTGEYFIAIVMAVVVGILFGIITGILSITVIGLILVPFIGFYANMAIANLIGNGVRNASTA